MVPPPPHRKPHLESLSIGALLTALVALGQISTSIYTPSMPSLVVALDTDAEQVNLTLSAFLFGFAVCQLVYGPLSDRYGRRPIVLTGVCLYLAATFACTFAPTIEALIVGRFVQGMAACSGPVLGRAIVRDIYGSQRSATVLAYIGAALAVSPAVAPIIGGYLQVWFGWRSSFVFLTGVGIIMLIAISALLDESNVERNAHALRPKELVRSYRQLLLNPTYLGYTLAVAFIFAGLMAFTAGAPFVFIDALGMSPERYGMLAVFNVAGYLVGSLATGRLTPRFGIDPLLLVGVCLCLLAGVTMVAIAQTGHVGVVAVIAPMAVFAMGLGVVLPNGMAGAMAPFPRMAGSASAVLGFIQMAVAGGASMAVHALASTSSMGMAMVIAATAALGVLAFVPLVWLRRHRR